MYNSHSIVFIHWLIAFYGYGVIAQPPGKEHSPVVGKGTDTQWVSNAISGIYITDVIFHFNNDIHRYEIKTEKCSEHIELYFDVPLWKETFQPDINSNDIPKSVNNVTSRIKGKGNEKTNSVMDQINEVLITSPKNRANSGTINYVNPADLIRFNSDKPSNSQPFSTVNVIINGENLDPEDGGYILVPVHCGNKHELMIDIEYTQELIISKARYNIVLDVPIFGNNNILKVLSISKSGIIYTYQPSLSRFHNLYVVSGYHSPGDIINIYVECKYGMPIYNGKELNQLSIILDESILLSHIEIVCDDVVQNDIKVVDKHLYTLKFQKELQEEIKPPTNVMVVHDSLNCKKYKEGGDCVISCPFVKKRFGPLIIDTDPTYRYFIHRLNIIEGYVSELHGHNAVSFVNNGWGMQLLTKESIRIVKCCIYWYIIHL
uniref:6-Cys domain-containing protein n=1 Tax=Babesia bovis TaxID=5865 RepID=A7ASC8_BABBO|eukprot:XP_001611015.1 hypothetical protein [Babesia bovis T2Bo]